ncbi:hypothetical protein [Phenylobacterium sp.]|uniref:hypothetical protein n=1 Tax=Phenylobacterium sp. TaxID=1871053 RepID=UPI0025CD9E73|nr:hypothetical protein [Phenylobacterium sp.]
MRNLILLACSAGLTATLCAGSATAHAVAGNRFFPATLKTDDPGVADELSLPTISSFKTGDDPMQRQLDVSGEYSKRLTPKLGISVGETWTQLKTSGLGKAQGFQNLEVTVKYQAITSAEHETIVAVGLSTEWADTGADRVGAEHHSTFTPSVYFGKGGGDLPDSLTWARPLALTGVVGYAIPDRLHDGADRNPSVLHSGFALEYSLPYLASHVKDYGLPDFLNHLTPLVEADFETPVAHASGSRTTGTINPGVIWAGRYYQLGAEATFPINHDSGRGVGFVVQLHVFLDDLFPRSIGKPVWSGQ